MSDYKNTLNLPSTDFPMKANLANREGGFLKEWHDQDLNQQIRNKFKGNPLFVLHDGPPSRLAKLAFIGKSVAGKCRVFL